jgi:carbon-monoxide dehydrogenase medium subunit
VSLVPHFAYHRPDRLDAALGLLAEHGDAARVIAGGTDLVPKLRAGRLSPAHLVSIGRIAELGQVTFAEPEGLVIGAGARIDEVARMDSVQDRYPALARACSVMATVQVRNMGTVAGNLANGSPCADTASPLLVYGAEVEIARVGGRRRLPLRDFYRDAGEVDLESGELVVAIHVPVPPEGSGSAYQRISARSRVDMAAAGVAGLLVLGEGGSRIDRARLALTAVAPTPLPVPTAESVLTGQSPTPEVLARAAGECAAAARPIDDVRASAAYRRHVIGVLARRVLEACVARAGGGAP